MGPRHLELADGLGVDLIEGAVVPALVAAVIGEPVTRILVGVLDVIVADIAEGQTRDPGQHGDCCCPGGDSEPLMPSLHRDSPF
jgi:hypothetical protein